MNRPIKMMFAAFVAVAALCASAAPITAEQAQRAVAKWVSSRPAAHMQANFTSSVSSVETVGDSLFHVVNLEGGGYVVTSTDSGVSPIIAFSDEGELEHDENNPLWVLLNIDLPQRYAAVAQEEASASTNLRSAPSAMAAAISGAEADWADLLSEENASADGGEQSETSAKGYDTIPDVRVPALVESRWNQSTVNVKKCYNYHTPSNYVCGCVATAGAQLIRYHEYPSGISSGISRSCWVNGSSVTKSTIGGTYNYNNMPLTPSSPTDAQCDAIGKLCYDVGVVTRMNWTSSGSGACPPVLAEGLSSVFKYSNVRSHLSQSMSSDEFKRAIYANLDGGYPVLLGIHSSNGSNGHEIVADGYGYYSGSIYTHLNLGWGGSSDAWYSLPYIGTGYNFSVVSSIVYNVFPDKTGELLTGRVTDSSGNAISGVTVKATDGATTKTATTNSKGIYALTVTGGKTWSVTATKSGYSSGTTSSYVASSRSSTLASVSSSGYSYYLDGSIGNSWGNDITLAAEVKKGNLYIDKFFLAHEDTSDESAGDDEFVRGEPIYSYSRYGNNGAGTAVAPFSIRHTLRDGYDNVIDYFVYTNRVDVSAGSTAAIYWKGKLEFLQGLPVGDYSFTVETDIYGQVAESDESDNEETICFTVVEPEAKLSYVEIFGADSVSAGTITPYSCLAWLTDGTSVETDNAVWTIDSGALYASVDAFGNLSVSASESDRTVILRATCTYNGVVKSATKVIDVRGIVSLDKALDNGLHFTTDTSTVTSTNAPWFGQTANYQYGGSAAKSGAIGNGGVSWMETTVTGPGTVSFCWFVSSENGYDELWFYVDGDWRFKASGQSGDWGQKDFSITGDGTHTLRWTYEKDESDSSGEDAVYVDNVMWTPNVVVPTNIVVYVETADGKFAVNAKESLQLKCRALMSDGTSPDVTGSCSWSIVSGGAYATIFSSGLLTAGDPDADSQVTVQATYAESGFAKTATAVVKVSALPAKPVITYAGPGDANSAIIRWNAASNAKSYRIYRDGVAVVSGLATLAYFDSDAEPGKEYSYSVAAVNAVGERVSDPATAFRRVFVSVDPSSVAIGGEIGSSVSVSVRSNAVWVASLGRDSSYHDIDWLNVSSNNDTVLISATSGNNTGEPRVASVFVTAGGDAGHPATMEVVVTQSAMPQDEGNPDLTFVSPGILVSDESEGTPGTLFDKGCGLYLRYGVLNSGDAEASGDKFATDTMLFNSGNEAVFYDQQIQDDFSLAVDCTMVCSEYYSDWGYLDPGVYRAYVQLNADHGIANELDESNNSAEYRFAIRDSVSLQEALDCTSLDFTTSDDEWYGTKGVGFDGAEYDELDAAVTKHIGDGQVNTMTAEVKGPGTVSFVYRVSSEAGSDVFRFKIDGVTKLTDSGIGDWKEVKFTITDEDVDKTHTLSWTYSKNGSVAVGDDCVYLDSVVWKEKRIGYPPLEGFSAEDGDTLWIALRWAEDENVEYYVIERRRKDDPDGKWIVVYEGEYSAFVEDKNIVGGVMYSYRIKAVYEDAESEWAYDDGWCKSSIGSYYAWSTFDAPGKAGAEGIKISANCEWTAECTEQDGDYDWLVISTGHGRGDGKVVFRLSKNDTGESRKATIVVTAVSQIDNGKDDESIEIYIEQRPTVNLGTEVSLAEAADNSTLKFTTSISAPWVGQTRIFHDGKSALRSGDISDNGETIVQAVVATGGELSFWWGSSSEGDYDELKFYIGDELVRSISGYPDEYDSVLVSNWEYVTIDIPDGGAILTWEYSKDGGIKSGEDAGFIDQITWTPRPRTYDPYENWWDAEKWAMILARLGYENTLENRAKAAMVQSPGSEGGGRKKTTVMEDYILGTDPLDSDDVFYATISIEDGSPIVSWKPQLEPGKAKLRNYVIHGKESLETDEWTPVASGHEFLYNFFKVAVEMK